MELNSGTVFCVPAPESIALPKAMIDRIIDNAIEQSRAMGIQGKDITPFLLSKVWEATQGMSVNANVEFVKNNARMGARIASCLAQLEV
jgi:pseudouridine-5'-phosphate glycosidase